MRDSFTYALAATDPAELVTARLPDRAPDLILAVGKAALTMLEPATLHSPLARWIATPPIGAAAAVSGDHGDDRTGRLLPATHPLPSPTSERAAAAALDAVARLGSDDLLLVLLSGGGSSLWSAPRGVGLAAKQKVTHELMLAGAAIEQLNTVRKHLSRIKGGGLAKATRARCVTLALSDVPGDDPGTIASGPTVTDATTYADALAVLDEFGVDAAEARAHLSAGARGAVPETPKPGDELESRSHLEVIASNRTLLEAAAAYWRSVGYPVVVLSDALQGEARALARAHADVAIALVRREDPSVALATLARPGEAADTIRRLATTWSSGGPLVLLSGGEATVTVTGGGRGGRNQEFALWLHHYLARDGVEGHVCAFAAGSDGVDGNSDAAGAVISPLTTRKATAVNLSPAAYLTDNDSHTFFHRLGDSVTTGPTGTNLNDYRALLIAPD